MRNNTKKLVYVTIAMVVFFSVYAGGTQAYGIPLWYILHFYSLSVVPSPGTMAVTVTPANPTQVGQLEVATVIDASEQSPLQGVNVTVTLGEGPPILTIATNVQGQASFSYGGSPTIITLQKDGYNTIHIVLPSAPRQWVSGMNMSAFWGILGSVPAWAGLFLEVRRGRHTRHTSKTRKKSR